MEPDSKTIHDHCISLLQERGVKISDITDIVYDLQAPYIENLNRQVCEDAVYRVLAKREVQNAVLTGVELDKLAEQGKLSEPLESLVNDDNPLFGIDEILVLSICNLYGSIGLTNFGYVDKTKPGIIGKLDREGKETDKCHTFLDDIIGAIAAAAASSVAHNNAK
ncbi:MAG TPA: phosphatidylglycerophosphatase A [Bacillota bacterium]|nr:phosphatidylglycerophosphatase A [Bacillota bacterium]HPF42066.1 phosphatidylglycerophosphatase A [Bacillota bacterium]HPJ85788.1 phosphatidylglycerophosphatase A [Bacillota bacterium]HPQ61513.1 phosphatidylglycerophosphatase A [Bacillota bacterium]HRX92107.1 phosphatidylglycerophosphatase A [Candidatus Izemoplasmatales bacterium]